MSAKNETAKLFKDGLAVRRADAADGETPTRGNARGER